MIAAISHAASLAPAQDFTLYEAHANRRFIVELRSGAAGFPTARFRTEDYIRFLAKQPGDTNPDYLSRSGCGVSFGSFAFKVPAKMSAKLLNWGFVRREVAGDRVVVAVYDRNIYLGSFVFVKRVGVTSFSFGSDSYVWKSGPKILHQCKR